MSSTTLRNPITESHAHSRLMPFMLILFFGSGCAALIYEIVWLQMLQLVIGLTTISLGVLLGVFMGGMCLGSYLLPRIISPRWHPLKVYAVLEAGIGLIGIAVLYGLPLIEKLYTANPGSGFGGIVVRAIVAGVCLLPPTVLMGATLPAMARWIEATPRGVSWLGFFYGGNIIGAVVGCLLAGFYLLRIHDMAVATYAAAAINGVVGVLATVMAKFAANRNSSSSICAVEIEPPSVPSVAEPMPNRIYLVIALSGVAALGAEVVWTRLLALMLGASVYTFSIILAVFLIGLGIGSNVGSFIVRTRARSQLALGICQALLVASVAWSAYAISRSLPNWPIDPSISSSPWFTFQLDIARSLWAILPAAILWGASFPLALASVTAGTKDPGKLVGGVYAANTIGAIVGALAFSLFVVPRFGTQFAQRLLIVLPALASLTVLVPLAFARQTPAEKKDPDLMPDFSFNKTLAVAALALIALTFSMASNVGPTPWGAVAYGRYMATYKDRLVPQIVEEKQVPVGGSPDVYCTYLGEGLNGSVAVTKWTSGVRHFHSAGKVQASNGPHDMRLQRLLGHISALAHNKPESVLVVACGAGVTAGSFTLHPDVKRIVICDIEPLVPKHVAPMFAKENYNVVNDPRTKVVFDDGRHFIRTTQEKFDIITSDPIDPWVKGCAALNTVGYYDMCKAHLKPGGVMTLWIPLYESSSESAKSLIATFFKVFPNGILWSNDIDGEGYDAVLFGQAEPTQIDVAKLQARIDRPDHSLVKESLDDVGFRNAVEMLATYAGQASDLQGWMAGAQINTDRNMRLQYLAGMGFNSELAPQILADITKYLKFPDQVFVGADESREKLRRAIQKRKVAAQKFPSVASVQRPEN